MRKDLKKISIVLLIIFVPAVLFFLHSFNPAEFSFFPKCPFHYFTGFDCPGCGSQRALHALLHGEILKAAGYNLLFLLSLPFLAVQFGHQAFLRISRRPLTRNIFSRPPTRKVIWIIVITFWILRNVPIEPFIRLKA